MNFYKIEMERLNSLHDIFDGVVKPETSDLDLIVQFFHENDVTDWDLRDARKCRDRCTELIGQLEETGEEEYNHLEN